MPVKQKTKKIRPKFKKVRKAARTKIIRSKQKTSAKIFGRKKTIIKTNDDFYVTPNNIAPIQEQETDIKKETDLLSDSFNAPDRPAFIKQRNSKLSPHVLNLKQMQADQETQKQEKQSEAQVISAEIFRKISKKKYSLAKSLQEVRSNLKNNLNKIKLTQQPKTLKINSLTYSKPKKTLKLPKINWPEFNWQMPQIPSFKINLFHLIFPSHWAKAIVSFFIFCLIFGLPFFTYGYYQKLQGKKNDVLQKTGQALWHLTLSQKAAAAQDLYYTQFELQAASQNFSQAKAELTNINFFVQNLIKIIPGLNSQFLTAKDLTAIGEKLAKSAAALTLAIEKINLPDSANEITPNNLNLTDKLTVLKDNLNLILPDLQDATADLEQIDMAQIPEQYRDKLKLLQANLPLVKKNVENFISSSDLLLNFLGQDSQKRYLVIFQNNHELRPTGGFIGSYALIDIDRGNLEKIDIPGGGPYDLKSGLKVNIAAPLPLQMMNQRWEFQDANWSPDLPTSAEKLMWFYEKSGGPTVDGVIFINATFLEKILSLTGPIDLPEYNKVISAENFFTEIQNSVELEYDRSINKPKQIIADLTPKVIDSLLHSDRQKLSEILDLFISSLSRKEIQLYFSNFNLEKKVLYNNWGGELKNTDSDYLNIISTNIAGEKTDAKINQTAKLEVNIQPDGTIINTLTLTKNHTGIKGENFYGVSNVDYLRIYVPKDSELISASGFSEIPIELFGNIDPEIYQKDSDLAYIDATKKIDPKSRTEIFEENNKTVFANWQITDPGQSSTIIVQYKLPFRLNLNPTQEYSVLNLLRDKLSLEKDDFSTQKYSLLWQKQSGRDNFNIEAKINFPENYNYQLIYPDNLLKNANEFNLSDQLNTDKFLAIIFKAD